MNYAKYNHWQYFAKHLECLRGHECLTDVILVAGRTRIPAHRIVLSAWSGYFRAMFSEAFKESHIKEIVLKDVDADILRLLIDFFYSGTLKLSNLDIALNVLSAAQYFIVPSVAAICYSFFKENVKLTKCLEVFTMAEQHNMVPLRDDTLQMIVDNFNFIRRTENFLHLSAEQLGLILKSDELDVTSEKDAFYALMDWYSFDKENRESALPALITLLRIPSSVTCKLLLNQLVDYSKVMQLIKDSDWNASPVSRHPKPILNNCLMAVTLQYMRPSNERGCEIPVLQWIWYDENALQWVEGAALRVDCQEIEFLLESQVLLGNTVLYFTDSRGRILKYDIFTNQWEFCETGCIGAGITCIEDSLYIVGGKKTKPSMYDSLNCVGEMKKDSFGIINVKTKMSFGRINPGVCVDGGKLYVIGGKDFHEKNLKSSERYCLSSDTWCMLEKHTGTIKIVSPVSVVVNGDVFCLVNLRSVNWSGCCTYRYSNEQMIWAKIPGTPRSVALPTACAYNNELFVTGMSDESTPFIVVYSPFNHYWRRAPAPTDVNNIRLVALPEDTVARHRWLALLLKRR